MYDPDDVFGFRLSDWFCIEDSRLNRTMSGSPIEEAFCCVCKLNSREKLMCFGDVFITIRYDTEYLPDAES